MTNLLWDGGWCLVFFMNSIVSVRVFILVPTPFVSRPNSFAILRVQTISVSDF